MAARKDGQGRHVRTSVEYRAPGAHLVRVYGGFEVQAEQKTIGSGPTAASAWRAASRTLDLAEVRVTVSAHKRRAAL